jgi:hypothetical protein
MKNTQQILDFLRKNGYKVIDGTVMVNGKEIGGILFSYPNGRVSRLETGIRYTVTCEGVTWEIDREIGESKPKYKVIRRVKIKNHIAG